LKALAQLRLWSDGEAVSCGEDGIASFDRIRYRQDDASVFLDAFDLVELNGGDLRRDPLAVRKATLASLLARAAPGLRFNEHLNEQDGRLCSPMPVSSGSKVSCRSRNSPYRSRRSPDWIKSKNPHAPAVRREAEEDWRR
jgi:bifunctional non-homologous end joining protein LigD